MEYMAWFAMECHWSFDQTVGTPWVVIVRLSLVCDDQQEAIKKANQQQQSNMRRMT